MKKVIIISVLFILIIVSAKAQNKFDYSVFIKQTGSYYISDRVTIGGVGLGIGAQAETWKNFASQFDCNILWGDGTAASTRLSFGYQLDGEWSPAVFITAGLLWGQRIEILSSDGKLPAAPVWVFGLRLAPIRFETESGFISALELGYGFGPDGGRDIEISVLSLGIKI